MAETYDKLGTKYFARRETVEGGDIDIVEMRHIAGYDGAFTQHTKSMVANNILTFCYDTERQPEPNGRFAYFERLPGVVRQKVAPPHHPDDPARFSPIVGIEVVAFMELPDRILQRQVKIPHIGKVALELLFDYADVLKAEYARFAG